MPVVVEPDRLLPPPPDAGSGAVPATGRIEIALADGSRVIVDQEVDGAALGRVLLVLERRVLRVEETKTGEPLELPVTRQLAAVFERCRDRAGGEGWLFPSTLSATGHLTGLHRYHAEISRVAGARFWFHALRNAFITVAERDLMLPRPLTKRLVNYARDDDVTEGYAADWTVEQLREPAQHVADRIEKLFNCGAHPEPAVP